MKVLARLPDGDGAAVYVTGRLLGGGNQGKVFACLEEDGRETELCVKICTESYREELAERLHAMWVVRADDWYLAAEHHLEVAWPVAAAENEAGETIGYFMTLLSADRLFPGRELGRPEGRARPFVTWGFHLAVAADVARVVGKLHRAGIVVGDLAPENLLVSNTGRVTLIDSDSFTFPGARPSAPWRREYSPPEGGAGASTVGTDRFAVGVLVCLLLAEWYHPFGGYYLDGDSDDADEAANIRLGASWLFHPRVRTNPRCPPPNVLPSEVLALASACFGRGTVDPDARPPVVDWYRALCVVAGRLRPCAENLRHVYDAARADDCPWCALRAQWDGADPYPALEQASPSAVNGAPAVPGIPSWLLRDARHRHPERAPRRPGAAGDPDAGGDGGQAERAAMQRDVLDRLFRDEAPRWMGLGRVGLLRRLVTELLSHSTGRAILADGLAASSVGPWSATYFPPERARQSLRTALSEAVAGMAEVELVDDGPEYRLRLRATPVATGRPLLSLPAPGRPVRVVPQVGARERARAEELFAEAARWLEMGRRAEALSALDRALLFDPGHPTAWRQRGIVRHEDGRSDEALEDLDRYLTLWPRDEWTLGFRGGVRVATGRYASAISDLDEALSLDPDDVWDLRKRAEAHHFQGNLRLALADLDRILSIAPGDPECLKLRGSVHLALGNFALAAADLDVYLTSHPDSSVALRERRLAYEGLNQRRSRGA